MSGALSCVRVGDVMSDDNEGELGDEIDAVFLR
jgi:hypothetical protein